MVIDYLARLFHSIEKWAKSPTPPNEKFSVATGLITSLATTYSENEAFLAKGVQSFSLDYSVFVSTELHALNYLKDRHYRSTGSMLLAR